MSYEQTVRVDFSKVTCADYLGMSAVYHAYAFSPEYERRGYTDADRAKEFELVREARMRVARSYFYPHYNCADIAGPYDMRCPRMESVRRWCAEMKTLGVDVAFQAGWHFPMNTYFGHDAPDPERDPEVFAGWITETLAYLVDECGLDNVRYLMLFTEPTSYASGIVPEGWTLWTYYVRVCRAIDAALKAKGLRGRIKLVGPNSTFGATLSDHRYSIPDGAPGGTNLHEAVRDLGEVIDIYSSHDYNFLHQGQWEGMCRAFMDVVGPTGKPFWLDEYGMQPEIMRTTHVYGNFIAQIQSAAMAAGLQTTMIWSLFDQLFPSNTPFGIPDDQPDDGSHNYNRDSFHNGVHRCGVHTFSRDDFEGAGAPYESWYAYRLLAQALGGERGGEKLVTHAVGHALTLYGGAVSQGDDYTVFVVNSNCTPADLVLDLGGRDRPLWRRVYAPFADLPACGTEAAPRLLPAEGGFLRDTLPKSGFAVYTTRETL